MAYIDNKNISEKEKEDILCAYGVIDKEIDTILKFKDSINGSLTKALDIMENVKGRIIISGIGKSGHIGKKIAASLSSTGSPSFFVHPAEASHGDLGMITDDDVVIAISNSGESKELIDVLNYCRQYNIKIISVTKNPNSTLAKAGDVLLLIPDNGEACPLGLTPTNSTTATLVLGDIITSALMKRKKFTKRDFNTRHPGGKLGSLLNKVESVMHKGDEMPILSENTDMQKAILVMTEKRLGCVGFINDNGEMTGMLTDGDLRRCLKSGILAEKVINLMTKTPITITKDTLAMDALHIMNDRKITNMFILEDKKPVGVVHIHDILKIGA